jgi:GH43 family beta-xylosidase
MYKKIIPYFLSILIPCLLSASSCNKKKDSPVVQIPADTVKRFSNPLIPGADPWVIKKDSKYYYLHTLANRIAIWKTDGLTKLNTVSPVTVFSPTLNAPNSKNIWAPELHFLDGKWYLYYTAGNGEDSTQRTWVLENSSADPTTGTWIDKGRIYNSNANFWAIDGTVLEYNGSRYFIWCGRPLPNNIDLTQKIYISKMTNPWTLEGGVTILTQPDFAWEKNGFPVNEGPEILKNSSGKVFLIYSASFCGTDDYALGQLTLKDGGNPLNAADWTKSPQPIFTKNVAGNTFGPGHNSFFKSVNGNEDWIIYHANTNSGDGCGDKRNVRMQKFNWNADGTPNFSNAQPTNVQMPVPGGE